MFGVWRGKRKQTEGFFAALRMTTTEESNRKRGRKPLIVKRNSRAVLKLEI